LFVEACTLDTRQRARRTRRAVAFRPGPGGFLRHRPESVAGGRGWPLRSPRTKQHQIPARICLPARFAPVSSACTARAAATTAAAKSPRPKEPPRPPHTDGHTTPHTRPAPLPENTPLFPFSALPMPQARPPMDPSLLILGGGDPPAFASGVGKAAGPA
jgi:hypothetical protein